MRRRTFLLSTAALCAGSAFPALSSTVLAAETAPSAPAAKAIQIGSIEYAPELQLAGKTLKLNGAGLRKIVFFKVYGAGLYLGTKTSDPVVAMADAGPRRVRLGLLRDVSGADFIEALEDGLNANLTPEGKASIEKELSALKSLMTAIGDVKENDLVDFDYVPSLGTIVSRNGTPVGDPIPGKPLYDAVLAIWLGEKPIDKTLKAGMLGLDD